MAKKRPYHFNEEFDKIDFCLEKKWYCVAGFLCGRMLEYMLQKIFGEFKSTAETDLLEKLATMRGGNLKIDKLGALIGFFTMQFNPTKQESKKIFPPVLKIVCKTLKVNYKNVRFIDFDELKEIRNNSVHLDKDNNIPTEDEIKHFKIDLEQIAEEFKDCFTLELSPNTKKLQPILTGKNNKVIKKMSNSINYETTILIIPILLACIAAIIVYQYY